MNQDTQNILDKMVTLSEEERVIWTNSIRQLIMHHTELSEADSYCNNISEMYESGTGAVTDDEMGRVQNYVDYVGYAYEHFFLSMPQELQNLMSNQQEIYLDLLITQPAE